MAVITSNASGLRTAGATWAGGIVPVVDDQTIIANPHIVENTGNWNTGNDTNQGIIIRGTLKASRTVNSKLTARGDIFVDALGTYDAGTELDPMPSTITHEMEMNDSATMASNKWGFRTNDAVNNWAGVRLWGAPKTRLTDVAIAYTVTSSVILDVTDATGWKINDIIVVETTLAQLSFNGHAYRKITAITGNQVTLSGSLGFVKPVGTKVMNLTSNVRVYGKQGNLYSSYFSIKFSGTHSTTDCVEIGETEFFCSSYASSDIFKAGNLTIGFVSASQTIDGVKRVYRPISHNVWDVVGSTVTFTPVGGGHLINCFGNQAYTYTIEEPILSSANHYGFTLYQGTNTIIQNIQALRVIGLASTGYSQGPVGTIFQGGYASMTQNMLIGTGISVIVEGMTINGVSQMAQQIAYGEYIFRNCTFGELGDYGAGTSGSWSNGAFGPILFENNTFLATGSSAIGFTRTSANLQGVTPQFSYFIRNKNNNVTLQERYVRGGKQERDNTIFTNSLSSLRLDSWYSTTQNVYSYKVNALGNQTMRILGKCRYNASYGTTYPATLTISGNGITPVTFTCPTSGADTWYPIDLTVTNPNSYPGDFTFTFTGQSPANTETASVWFSGITIPDFVTVSRHYGFQFLGLPYQTVNPYITVTNESTVGAYSFTINHGTKLITPTADWDINKLRDYLYYDLCQNANLGIAEYMNYSDTVTDIGDYNIVNNYAGTGIGTLITTGTYTGTGSTTLVVKDSVGVRCKITSGGSPFTIKGETIAYTADVNEKIITVATSTNVSFVLYKLGYKPTLITINSGLLGGTYDIALTNISEAVDTVLNVAPIIGLTSTSVDGSGYHIFFGEMELSLEQMKSVVHRLMKFENYFDAVLATGDDNIVEVRTDEIRVNRPLFTIERDPVITLADRVQLNGYINIANAVAIDPLYIINPGDTDGLYVTFLTVKPGIDANYLAQKVWENDVRTLTSSAGLTAEEHDKLMSIGGGFVRTVGLDAIDKKYLKETHEKVLELKNADLPQIDIKLNEINSHNKDIIEAIQESELEICSDIVRVKKELKDDNILTRNLVRLKTKKIDENVGKIADRQDKTDQMIEDEAEEIEIEIERIINEEADMIEHEMYSNEADKIESEITSNQSNDGND